MKKFCSPRCHPICDAKTAFTVGLAPDSTLTPIGSMMMLVVVTMMDYTTTNLEIFSLKFFSDTRRKKKYIQEKNRKTNKWKTTTHTRTIVMEYTSLFTEYFNAFKATFTSYLSLSDFSVYYMCQGTDLFIFNKFLKTKEKLKYILLKQQHVTLIRSFELKYNENSEQKDQQYALTIPEFTHLELLDGEE